MIYWQWWLTTAMVPASSVSEARPMQETSSGGVTVSVTGPGGSVGQTT